MKINSYINSLQAPPAHSAPTPRPTQEVVPSPAARPVKSDSVQISDAGRRMNAEQREALNPERIAELRQKVLTGAYNSLDMVDQVARRILTRGEL